MCKVLIVSGIKKANVKKAQLFMKEMGAEMSPGNNDGLGYAAIDSKGQLFGQRWLVNDTAFKPQVDLNDVGDEGLVIDKFDKVLKTRVPAAKPTAIEMNSFGEVNLDDMVAFTLHTRAATTPKGMANTHPFVTNDTSLIHNGVIHNHNEFKLTQSTCDSEAILVSYLEHGVALDSNKIEPMAKSLVGYYVAAVFGRDANGQRILDVAKAHNPRLCVVYIRELGTYVMTSLEYDVKNVCRKLGWKMSAAMDYRDEIFMRFNPFNGDMIEYKDFSAGKQYSGGSTSQSNFPSTTQRTSGGASGSEGNNSWDGAKVIEASSRRKPNLTKAHVEFYQNTPQVIELGEQEALEWQRASGYQ